MSADFEYPESPPRFIEADGAFRLRDDDGQVLRALEMYRGALSADPDDWQAGFRVAMACYHVGMRIAPTKEERKRIYAEGRDAGRRAAELAPDCADCHFWTAINMTLYGQSAGVIRMLFTLSEIRERLERSMALQPDYAFGGAQRLLAMIEDGLPFFLGGSDARAREYYEMAIAVAPDEPLNYEYYAVFLQERREFSEALQVAQRGLLTPPVGPERVESVSSQRVLRELAAQLAKQAAAAGG